MVWISSESGTCFHNFIVEGDIYHQLLKKRPVVGFDFDDTLVDLKTREILPNVIEKLKTLYETCDIVIFSNQLGVKRGKVTNKGIQNVFDTFIGAVKFLENAGQTLYFFSNSTILYPPDKKK